jgi:phage-related minor tail protein
VADLSVAVEILGKDSGASSVIDSVSEKLGGLGKFAVVGATAAVGAIAGIGVAAFKIGEEFDAAFDTIRVTTGATGDALAGLQDDFRAVASSVPGSFDQVSAAVAGLNQRTGQTGPALQELAGQMVNLSNLTGTDVATNVGLATRVFGDWSVATEDQGKTLDLLFRASQATGLGIGELQAKVVQFGAPLRAMGFSLTESATMLGKWEKEGVNTELVLGSMRIAMGNFAKDNIPMRQGLEQTIARIQELGPGAEATTIAMQTFGARAGPDMAAAILEGRFALGDLLDTVANGSETINAATADTADFAEKWTIFANRAKIALEPAGGAVFALASTLLDRLAPAFESAVTGITPFLVALGGLVGFLASDVGSDASLAGFTKLQTALESIFGPEAAGQIVGFISDFKANLDALGQQVSDAWNTVVQVFQGDWSPSDEIDQTVNSIGIFATFLRSTVIPAVTQFVDFMSTQFETMLSFIQSLWDRFGPTILASVQTILANIEAFWTAHGEQVMAILSAAFFLIQGVIEAAMTVIAGVVTVALQLLAGDWSGAWETMQTLLQTVWDTITLVIVPNALLVLQTILTAGWTLIQLGASLVWDAIVLYFVTLWTVTLPELFNTASAALVLLLNTTWATIQTAVATAWELFKTTIATAVAGVLTGLTTWAGEVIGSLGTLAANALKAATDIGANIIKGIVDAVNKGKDDLGKALENLVSDALNAAKKALGLDHDTGAVTEIGRLLIDEIVIGAKGKAGELAGALQGIVSGATAGLAVNLPGSVTDWLSEAINITGVSPSWLAALQQLTSLESGGSPTAQNPEHVFSNGRDLGQATGLLQTIPGTFSGYALPGHGNILNPIDNAIASIRYIQARYRGDPWAAVEASRRGGYDAGGWLLPGTTLTTNNTGRPEPVLTPQQWDALSNRRDGDTYHIEVTGIGLSEVADEIMRRLEEQQLLYGARGMA